MPANAIAEWGDKISRAENREKANTRKVSYKDLATKLRFGCHVSTLWIRTNKRMPRPKLPGGYVFSVAKNQEPSRHL